MNESWLERKQTRRAIFISNMGMKTIPCMACNGSGRYDSNGAPPCGGCKGTGKEKVTAKYYEEYMAFQKMMMERERKYREDYKNKLTATNLMLDLGSTKK